MIACHTDVVGSLLRPPELLQARDDFAAGRIDDSALRAAEDRAVDEAIALQEEAGLDVVTDGEMRRLSFQSQMTAAVEGFGVWDLDAFLWGDWHGDAPAGDARIPRPPNLGVVSKLERTRPLSVHEFEYLRPRTSRIPKVALPSPSLFANFWSPERSTGAYPTLDAFLADVADILRTEVADLARAGATYVQIDAPHYTLLLDPATRSFYERRGWAVDQWLEQGIDLDNAVMQGWPDITFGFHLCRGNQGSRWLVRGGYDAIARPIFRRVKAQRLLLEYDTDRAGSFAPLREVPDDLVVVLGLVGTKHARCETPEELLGRLAEASLYIPRERLALSPQCGFATSIIGNRLTVADERAKLKVIAEAARAFWG